MKLICNSGINADASGVYRNCTSYPFADVYSGGVCTDSANQIIQEATAAINRHIDISAFSLNIEEEDVTSGVMCYCDTDRCNTWSGDQIKMAAGATNPMTLPAATTPSTITEKGNITFGGARVLYIRTFLSK